jgi:adenine-specific DNA methylase
MPVSYSKQKLIDHADARIKELQAKLAKPTKPSKEYIEKMKAYKAESIVRAKEYTAALKLWDCTNGSLMPILNKTNVSMPYADHLSNSNSRASTENAIQQLKRTKELLGLIHEENISLSNRDYDFQSLVNNLLRS